MVGSERALHLLLRLLGPNTSTITVDKPRQYSPRARYGSFTTPRLMSQPERSRVWGAVDQIYADRNIRWTDSSEIQGVLNTRVIDVLQLIAVRTLKSWNRCTLFGNENVLMKHVLQ